MRTQALARVLVVPVLSLVLAGAACKERKAEVNGIGPFVLKKTTLLDGEIHARCQAEGELTWCMDSRQVPIGDQKSDVQLYFAGHGKEAPLVEIALTVRGCNAEAAELSLRKALGEPTETHEAIRVWALKYAFVHAGLRHRGTECEISFVDPADQKRITELRTNP